VKETAIAPRQRQEVATQSLDPQALIESAIKNNAAVETMEKLVALAERIQANRARSAWYDAMAEFQRSCPSPKKDKTAAAGSYSFKYATLDEWMQTILPVMGPLGLSVSWKKHAEVKDSVTYSCVISHALGHSEESGPVTMPVMAGLANDRGANAAQRVGIAHSYAMRYSLRAIVGLAPTDDDEASAPAPAAEPTPQPSGEIFVARGVVKSVDTRKGITNGRAWTVYDIVLSDGTKYGTFHDTDRDFAKSAIGAEVEIEWNRTAKGNNAIVKMGPPSEDREPGDEQYGD
jgi:hypothetical protein